MLISKLIAWIIRGLRSLIHRNDPLTEAEVDSLLTELASKSPEKLDWQSSIVDMMKLLNLDPSLKARRKLAEELDYGRPFTGSAEDNLWLAKEVRHRVAEGSVDSLRP